MKFGSYIANYWGKSSKVKNNTEKNGDCAIRAICLTTGYGYKKVCEMLGVGDEFILGLGYGYADGQGISIDQLDEFADKTGIIEKVWEDDMFAAQLGGYGKDVDFADRTAEDMLGEFMENYFPVHLDMEGKSNMKKFIVVTISNKARKMTDNLNMHVTAVGKTGTGWMVIDAPSNRDVVNQIPVAIYGAVKECDPESPDHYNNEMKTLNKELKVHLKGLKKDKSI